jgi:hypothetical protein
MPVTGQQATRHVTAQLEDPANLGKWQNPAYRLITIILMRCGLRITDATAIPSGCVIGG